MTYTDTENITHDTLLNGQIQVQQLKEGYRISADTVFLAAAVPAQAGDTVLDVGAGVGGASLCLDRRVSSLKIVALEIQPEIAKIAEQNVKINNTQERIRVIEGSVSHQSVFLKEGSFSHVVTNPPYYKLSSNTKPPQLSKALSHIEDKSNSLDTWLKFCLFMLKPKGTLTLIHRPERLREILQIFEEQHAGGITIFPLWPYANRQAVRLIIQARKNIKAPLKLLPGLILHQPHSSAYTEEALAILRKADPLEL